MAEMTVLVLCDLEAHHGKLIQTTLVEISDLLLDRAQDREDLQQKLTTQEYDCVVVESELVGEVDGNNPLQQEIDHASCPPVLYIVDGKKGVDNVALFSGLGLVDFLLTPTTEILVNSKVQIFLELSRQKKMVSFYREELEAKSLEIEVLQQELLEKNYQLELLSSLDSLTGLFTRYYFDENLQKEWRQAVRQAEPLSLLFVNVDLLKPYNEYYGRSGGDELLRELSGAIHGTLLRPVDIVARYGGDQFATILPGTDKAGAELVATRMLENVDALKKEHRGAPGSGQVSISIGGATMRPALVDKLTELTKKAERALEEAKRAGRNRVFHK